MTIKEKEMVCDSATVSELYKKLNQDKKCSARGYLSALYDLQMLEDRKIQENGTQSPEKRKEK